MDAGKELRNSHDNLSEALETEDAGNDDVRAAAVDMCAALNAFWAAEETIGDRQATFDQWYSEWLTWPGEQWKEKTPESLLAFFKSHLCWRTEDPE